MQTGYKIEVFSKNNCLGCNKVKQLLNTRKLVYQELRIDEPSGTVREELFKRIPNVKTVPQVFINGVLIGGLDDLIKELSSNDYY